MKSGLTKRLEIKIQLLISFLFITINFEVRASLVEVQAVASTELPPIKSDVMDDPAIWINKENPSESLILATNKKPPYGGLYVYILEGRLKERVPLGPLNNVDSRTNFSFKKVKIDIAVATHTQKKQLAFFAIEPHQGNVSFLGFSPNSFQKIPYGLCLLKRKDDFYAIVTFVGGGVEKWKFWENNGKIYTEKVKSYPITTEAEGCVANDQDGTLFIAEEDKGIWAFSENTPPHMMAKVGEHDLKADLEGLTLYQGKYLIVSSQGNSTYGVFSSKRPYKYLGSFKITSSSTQEGTEESDGIDATSINLGGDYSKGLFITHDSRSSKGGGSNFKLVPWKKIAEKLKLD